MNKEKFNIYIIEDSNIVTFLLKRMVKYLETPSELICFENGEPALVELKKNAELHLPLPDVIFMDIHMPVMDGWEFLDELVAHSCLNHIPVYIVSASIDPKDEVRAKRYSFVKGFLPKPLTPNHINEIINIIKSECKITRENCCTK